MSDSSSKNEAFNKAVHQCIVSWRSDEMKMPASKQEEAIEILTMVSAVGNLREVDFPRHSPAFWRQWLEHADIRDGLCDWILRCHAAMEYDELIGLSDPTSDTLPGYLTSFPHKMLNIGVGDFSLKWWIAAPIAAYLERMKPRLLSVLHGDRVLPTWDPGQAGIREEEFIRSLRVPNIADRPCLLLHELGSTFLSDESCRKRLFGTLVSPRLLFDSAGRGKTRTLLEGLCKKFGLYLVFSPEDNIGSSDLQSALAYYSNLGARHAASASPELPFDHQERIILYTTRRVLYARLLVLELLLTMTSDESYPSEEQKRIWTLIQLAPRTLLDSDCFADLFDLLSDAPYYWLESKLRTATSRAWRYCEDPPVLFVVVDEVAASHHSADPHPLEDGQPTPRSVFKKVLRSMQQYSFSIIVSGNERERDSMPKVAMFATSDIHIVPQCGEFVDLETVRVHMQRFFAPWYLESPSGQHLIVRVHRWLAGRFGFVASFTQAVLQSGRYELSHAILTNYIKSLTTYTPQDCPPQFLHLDDTLHSQECPKIFDISTLNDLPEDHRAVKYIYDCIFRCFLATEPEWKAPSELGLLSLTRSRSLENPSMDITEPLVLLAIFQWLRSDSFRKFWLHIQERLQDQMPLVYHRAFPFYLCELLEQEKALEDTFQFLTDAPEWASLTASVLSVTIGETPSNDTFTTFRYPSLFDRITNRSDIFTSAHYGYANQSITWFKDPSGVPFLLANRAPTLHSGPDCFALARLSDDRLLWIVMEMSRFVHGTDMRYSLGAEDLRTVASRLMPSNFCKKNKDESDLAQNPIWQGMRRIARCEGHEDPLLLRLVVVSPPRTNVYETFWNSGEHADVIRDGEKHPLAVALVDSLHIR